MRFAGYVASSLCSRAAEKKICSGLQQSKVLRTRTSELQAKPEASKRDS
jgi:hypothetical protein